MDHLANYWAMKNQILLVLTLLGLVACNQHEVEEVAIDYGYDYFPVEPGRAYYYEVDSLVFDPVVGGIAIDSSRTYIREVVADTLIDNTGAVLYRLERYERTSDTLPWDIRRVYTLQKTDRQAFRTEDNLRFIKLTFPARIGEKWDGHVFFDDDTEVIIGSETLQMFKDWSYEVIGQEEFAEVGTLSFEDVLTVRNADSENLIEYRFAEEKYARGIGLIYREVQVLDTQCNACCGGNYSICDGLSWVAKAEKGLILRQRLVDYR